MSVQEAAERLGVHRSRVEALILAGALPATKTGSQWVLERRELDLYDNVRPYRRGRPLGASIAWARIGRPDVMLRRREPGSLDADRRDLRARAVHESLSVHPGVLGEHLDDPEVRLGGRDAAIDPGAPLDPDGVHQLVAGEARSLAIPGGRRALEVAEPVTMLLGDDWAPAMFGCPPSMGRSP